MSKRPFILAGLCLLAVTIPGCALTGPVTRAYHATTGKCGFERWAVKTMTDANAGDIILRPRNARIAGLITRQGPSNIISGFFSPRIAPVEDHTFTLTGKVIYDKHEADQDIHLALEDLMGNTMIVESTDPGCASGSRVLPQMTSVRNWVDANFSSLLGSTVTVSGVGFFDIRHGQTGVAPNGIELHPLTAISFAQQQPVPAIHLRISKETD